MCTVVIPYVELYRKKIYVLLETLQMVHVVSHNHKSKGVFILHCMWDAHKQKWWLCTPQYISFLLYLFIATEFNVLFCVNTSKHSEEMCVKLVVICSGIGSAPIRPMELREKGIRHIWLLVCHLKRICFEIFLISCFYTTIFKMHNVWSH